MEPLGRLAYLGRWLALLAASYVGGRFIAASLADDGSPRWLADLWIYCAVGVEFWLFTRRLSAMGFRWGWAFVGFAASLPWVVADIIVPVTGPFDGPAADVFIQSAMAGLAVGAVFRLWLFVWPSKKAPPVRELPPDVLAAAHQRLHEAQMRELDKRLGIGPGPTAATAASAEGRREKTGPGATAGPTEVPAAGWGNLSVMEPREPNTAERMQQRLGRPLSQAEAVAAAETDLHEERRRRAARLEQQERERLAAPPPLDPAVARWKPLVLLGSLFLGAYLGLAAGRSMDDDLAAAGALIGAVLGTGAAWAALHLRVAR